MPRRHPFPFLSIGFLLFAAPAVAQLSDAEFESIRLDKVVIAVRLNEAITLDGRLDEPVWQTALPATDFYQKLPNNGAPASERTEVRFAYDDDNLYIGVTAFDSSPERLLIKDLREDFDFGTTDLIQVLIDSLRDGRSGFTFVVNPAGARRDTQVSNNGTTNQDWDGVWDAKVSRDEKAWFVESHDPVQDVAVLARVEPGMGAQRQPEDHAPQRREQLGPGADPLQRHPPGARRHAARTGGRPAGTQPEDQAVRDCRRHAGARRRLRRCGPTAISTAGSISSTA